MQPEGLKCVLIGYVSGGSVKIEIYFKYTNLFRKFC